MKITNRIKSQKYTVPNETRDRLGRLADRKIYGKLLVELLPVVADIYGLRAADRSLLLALGGWLAREIKNGIRTIAEATLALSDLRDSATQTLLDDLFVTTTSFFRHRAQYRVAVEVFDRVFGTDEPGAEKRIWVPACSSGNEAYSLAMILARNGYDKKFKVEILGTDIVETMIEVGRLGRYYYLDDRVDKDMDTGTDELIAEFGRFFVRDAADHLSTYVSNDIRRMVEFRLDNLFWTQVEGKFDVISCHELFLHLEPSARQVAAEVLLEKLPPRGYLLTNGQIFEQMSDRLEVAANPENLQYYAYRRIS